MLSSARSAETLVGSDSRAAYVSPAGYQLPGVICTLCSGPVPRRSLDFLLHGKESPALYSLSDHKMHNAGSQGLFSFFLFFLVADGRRTQLQCHGRRHSVMVKLQSAAPSVLGCFHDLWLLSSLALLCQPFVRCRHDIGSFRSSPELL